MMQNQDNGLTPEQIDNLPLHIYKKDTETIEQEPCTICLEEFIGEQEIRTLPCLHQFHKGCVDKWLYRQNHCPNCRAEVRG